ncbi:MAG: response regulator transcription factor [Caldilineaceae bacterium]
MKIKILLADDQALFREGLHLLLAAQPDFEVVGEAANGAEVLQLAAALRPQIVLMDLRMPILDGVEATRRLHATQPDCRVIALTTFDDDDLVFAGLRAGAVGYLLKAAPSPRLIEAIRTVARGGSILDPAVIPKVLAEFSRLANQAPPSPALAEPLSERELEVLRLVATGATNRAIAETLFLAEGTVRNHLTNILGKLGVSDRTQAAVKAKEFGLV